MRAGLVSAQPVRLVAAQLSWQLADSLTAAGHHRRIHVYVKRLLLGRKYECDDDERHQILSTVEALRCAPGNAIN